MRILTILTLLCLCLFSVACGNNENNTTNNTSEPVRDVTSDTVLDTTDATSDETVKMDETLDATQADDTPDSPNADVTADEVPDEQEVDEAPDEVSTGEGVLVGSIVRTAPIEAGEDGMGTVYIAVFTESPISGIMANPNAMLVAFQGVDGADLSMDSSSITYRIEGIPLRAEPYYISAFLDDNDNVDEQMPDSIAPDKPDPIDAELQGFSLSFPTVTVDSAAEVTFDLDLKFKRPF